MSVLKPVTGKRPKLIATDLDGTIVAHYGFISDRTKIAFAAAHAAGIHIYFITGRPIRWMKEIKDNFNFGLGVCGNGALLYDFINEKVLEEWSFSEEKDFPASKRSRRGKTGRKSAATKAADTQAADGKVHSFLVTTVDFDVFVLTTGCTARALARFLGNKIHILMALPMPSSLSRT